MLDLCCKSIDFQVKASQKPDSYIYGKETGTVEKTAPESIIIIFLDNYVDIFERNSYISDNKNIVEDRHEIGQIYD